MRSALVAMPIAIQEVSGIVKYTRWLIEGGKDSPFPTLVGASRPLLCVLNLATGHASIRVKKVLLVFRKHVSLTPEFFKVKLELPGFFGSGKLPEKNIFPRSAALC